MPGEIPQETDVVSDRQQMGFMGRRGMRQTLTGSRRRRWLRQWRIALLGIILGLLQALVLSGFLDVFLPTWAVIALAALFYLLIPTLAGFLASRQIGDTGSGVGAGCLAGGIGILGSVIALSVIAFIPHPPPPCQPHCRIGFYIPSSLVIWVIAPYIISIEGLVALVGGLSGGSIGGFLGKRFPDGSNRRSEPHL